MPDHVWVVLVDSRGEDTTVLGARVYKKQSAAALAAVAWAETRRAAGDVVWNVTTTIDGVETQLFPTEHRESPYEATARQELFWDIDLRVVECEVE